MPPGQCQKTAERIATMKELPDTRIQVEKVAAFFGAEPKLGPKFTEEAVMEAGSNGKHRIMYFATHRLLPADLACLPEPALLTSRPAKFSATHDGVLVASEIVNLDLDANLVVLSACDTGGSAGRQPLGESLSGLARAFFYAGGRTLLVSHWKIDPKATSELMIRTFEHMRTGKVGVSQALAMSQQAMITAGQHPFLWGAFTVIGDGQDPSSAALRASR
jgi:CHAT domain-containing protein